MTLVVTGAAGRLGSVVAAHLARTTGHVLAVDRRAKPSATPQGVSWATADLTKVDEVRALMQHADAVVHLAAIPGPMDMPPHVIFGNNTMATFVVLQAAADMGVRRAVVASSGAVTGVRWAPHQVYHRYLPIDEEYPAAPSDAYSLSKLVTEQICAAIHRSTRLSIVLLRFPWVGTAETARERVAMVAESPEVGRREAWSYLDVRDAAAACEAAVRANDVGCEVIGVAAADNLSETDTVDLIHRYSPSTTIRQPLPGTAGLWDLSKAARVLKWRPRYSWRDQTTAVYV